MDIKEIALRIGEEADEYADAKLQSKGEFHPDWHTVRDEYFAEAIVAELAKQNKPVAELLSLFPGKTDSYIKARAIGVDPFNTWAFPHPGTKLYTYPPTAEQIANETAEACAKYVNRFLNGDGIQDEAWIRDIESGIRRGTWKEFK